MEAPSTANPADILPKAIYYQVAHTLRGLLPPPITDTPEDEARRDLAAIAHVASLLPANAEEADIASHYVAAKAQALVCIRLSRACPNDPTMILKCTAQAASMMCQALRWRALLQRLQAARREQGKDTAAHDAATATEQRALGLLADALAQAPPLPEPVPEPVARPHSLAEAEAYAIARPSEAALIRSLGRLPKKFNGGPLSPMMVHDIVNGASPILQALAKRPSHRLAA
ncbi:MAG TPA: hypothetical protein VKI44_12405 [Acetobacteraceae bacterium]|nr:hypothetical protein [Acetobacteraceae bacterium]